MADRERTYRQPLFKLAEDATELILLRHGASAHVVPGTSFPLTEGWSDPVLAPEGTMQARAAAERLAAEEVSRIFVTGLVRTAETAAPLAELTGLEPELIEELREVKIGDWEGGQFRVRVAEGDPRALEVFERERWDVIPNAEPMESFADRIHDGVERAVAATGPGKVGVAVAHAGTIAEICRQATASRNFAFSLVQNGSVSRLIVAADRAWTLRSFNDTAHLDPLADRLDGESSSSAVPL